MLRKETSNHEGHVHTYDCWIQIWMAAVTRDEAKKVFNRRGRADQGSMQKLPNFCYDATIEDTSMQKLPKLWRRNPSISSINCSFPHSLVQAKMASLLPTLGCLLGFFLLLGSTEIENSNRKLLSSDPLTVDPRVSKVYRTSYHFQPSQNWMNGMFLLTHF